MQTRLTRHVLEQDSDLNVRISFRIRGITIVNGQLFALARMEDINPNGSFRRTR